MQSDFIKAITGSSIYPPSAELSLIPIIYLVASLIKKLAVFSSQGKTPKILGVLEREETQILVILSYLNESRIGRKTHKWKCQNPNFKLRFRFQEPLNFTLKRIACKTTSYHSICQAYDGRGMSNKTVKGYAREKRIHMKIQQPGSR